MFISRESPFLARLQYLFSVVSQSRKHISHRAAKRVTKHRVHTNNFMEYFQLDIQVIQKMQVSNQLIIDYPLQWSASLDRDYTYIKTLHQINHTPGYTFSVPSIEQLSDKACLQHLNLLLTADIDIRQNIHFLNSVYERVSRLKSCYINLFRERFDEMVLLINY